LSQGVISHFKMQENLLTAEQVAEYLKVDKFTIYRLVAQKKIPAFRVGSQWRFKKSVIEDWLMTNSNIKDKQA
jgi:excisionase family DNA binding protein